MAPSPSLGPRVQPQHLYCTCLTNSCLGGHLLGQVLPSAAPEEARGGRLSNPLSRLPALAQGQDSSLLPLEHTWWDWPAQVPGLLANNDRWAQRRQDPKGATVLPCSREVTSPGEGGTPQVSSPPQEACRGDATGASGSWDRSSALLCPERSTGLQTMLLAACGPRLGNCFPPQRQPL